MPSCKIPHKCPDCGEYFLGGVKAIRCPGCRPIHRRAYIRDYTREKYARSMGGQGLKFGDSCERCKRVPECRAILWTQAPLLCFAERKKMHWRTRRKLAQTPAVMLEREP